MAASLEERIQRLEDIEAIKYLKAEAEIYADRMDEEAFCSLLTEDCALIGVKQQHYGRDAIKNNVKFWPFAVHYASNPKIEVNGDTAKGEWYLFMPHTNHENGAMWAGAYYEDEYVKVDGEWKFKVIKLSPWFWSSYENGWAKEPVE